MLCRKAHLSILLCTCARKKATRNRQRRGERKKKGKKEKGKKKEIEINVKLLCSKCEVTVHAGGTGGVAPLVIQVGAIRR
jgi:hypothetical protein